MPRQFLLNRDGSIPANTNVALLESEGIPLVLPSDPPVADGMIAVESEPVLGSDGIYRQAWILMPDDRATLADNSQQVFTMQVTAEQRNILLELLKFQG